MVLSPFTPSENRNKTKIVGHLLMFASTRRRKRIAISIMAFQKEGRLILNVNKRNAFAVDWTHVTDKIQNITLCQCGDSSPVLPYVNRPLGRQTKFAMKEQNRS